MQMLILFHATCRDGTIPTITLILGGNLTRGTQYGFLIYVMVQHWCLNILDMFEM